MMKFCLELPASLIQSKVGRLQGWKLSKELVILKLDGSKIMILFSQILGVKVPGAYAASLQDENWERLCEKDYYVKEK